MFMMGLMVASVILTELKNYIPPFRLIGEYMPSFAHLRRQAQWRGCSTDLWFDIGVGMAVWVLAALGSGSSQGFWSLLLARCLVGAGAPGLCLGLTMCIPPRNILKGLKTQARHPSSP